MKSESLPDKAGKKTETDPKRKEGQGLDFWAGSLLEQGLIDQKEYDDFVANNNSKMESMDEKGVPHLKFYGHFKSTGEIRSRLSFLNNQRFVIRCKSRESDEVRRLLDASIDKACEFAEKLPGGFEKWEVEMNEFVETKAAGTIIIEPSGKTTIETWRGPHYLNTEPVPKYYAEFDPGQFDHHFRWTAPNNSSDLLEMQEESMKALRYFFPYLKPKLNEPMYIEYGVRPSGEIYFIETNDSPLLTGRSKKEE
jgi:hypothetical protein